MENNLSSGSDTSCSSSARDYELSDIDEDYDITNGKHSKRLSRGERDKLKRGHQTPELYHGNTRRWFPDEHTRRIESQPNDANPHRPHLINKFNRRNFPQEQEEFLTI